MDFFRRADRVDAILFSAIFLLLAAFFGYFGIRGLLLFLDGSRTAPAEPVAWTIGIAACLALIYLAARLLAGGELREALLPSPVLLIGSRAALGGAGWMVVLNRQLHESLLNGLGVTVGSAVLGVAGLVAWWRRRRNAA